jgi:hypothetical protein
MAIQHARTVLQDIFAQLQVQLHLIVQLTNIALHLQQVSKIAQQDPFVIKESSQLALQEHFQMLGMDFALIVL